MVLSNDFFTLSSQEPKALWGRHLHVTQNGSFIHSVVHFPSNARYIFLKSGQNTLLKHLRLPVRARCGGKSASSEGLFKGAGRYLLRPKQALVDNLHVLSDPPRCATHVIFSLFLFNFPPSLDCSFILCWHILHTSFLWVGTLIFSKNCSLCERVITFSIICVCHLVFFCQPA